MPRAKTLMKRIESSRFKALFVVLVLLLNVSFATLSSASAYAQTTGEEPVVAESLEEQPTEVTTTAETESEEIVENESTEEETEEATAEEEALPVSTDAVAEETTEVAELTDVEAGSDLDASFKCWTRVGLTEYVFTVAYETTYDEMWMPGSDNNYAEPETYNAILPNTFPASDESLMVSGWDGVAFDWYLNGNAIAVSQEGENCGDTTLGDIVVENANTEVLETIIGSLAESKTRCSKLARALFDADEGQFTIFAPTDSAIFGLVTAPGDVSEELNQLLGNPDELCALIGSHIVAGEIVSTDATTEGVTVPTLLNDMDGLFIQNVDGTVYVDGAAVTSADNFAANGVVHVVNAVLLPTSVGSINSIVTDKTSPALSGSISPLMMTEETEYPQMCVVVRIDGVPYIADVNGMTWSIDEGVVSLNPTKESTLFDVVVRSARYYVPNADVAAPSCDFVTDEMQPQRAEIATQALDVVTHGGELFGLTMNRSVVTYLQPEEPEEEEGEVLGEQTPIAVVTETPVTYAPAVEACGKGVCDGSVAQASDPSTTDTDGDGVVDSEDPDPNDPNVTGLEGESDSSDTADENDDASDEDDGDTNVLLWFLAGGGVVAIWYLLWQRSGREQ